MRTVITLWQPWAQWVALGWKTIETRTHDRFACLKGQIICIHAGLKWDPMAQELAYRYMTVQQEIVTDNRFGMTLGDVSGKIIATVFVRAFRKLEPCDSQAALIECKTPRWGLILESPILLPQPIAVRGKQGIWHYEG